MPLYTACPCRKDSTPYMAQMMRVFVVTPSSTINTPSDSSTSSTKSPHSMIIGSSKWKFQILLKPRVQPNPQPCPIFWPSHQGPIELAENSIWILRLPYIYAADDGKPFYRPKDFETLNNCRVLRGMFSFVLNTITN
jgi:hypothetical protein